MLTSGEHTKPAGPQGCGRRSTPTPWRETPSGTSSSGGQDGLVNILGILGVLAGGGGRTILLSTGLAAAITESISMGAVGYTSTVADRDYYTAQRTEEESALVDDADLECQEIIELCRSKGFQANSSTRSWRPSRPIASTGSTRPRGRLDQRTRRIE